HATRSRSLVLTIGTSLTDAGAPEIAGGRLERAARDACAAFAVARQPPRTVEIDEVRRCGQMQRRGNAQRGANHAPDHNAQSALARGAAHAERLRKSSGLVELYVDHLVARADPLQVRESMHR